MKGEKSSEAGRALSVRVSAFDASFVFYKGGKMNLTEIKIPSTDGIHSLRTKVYTPDTEPIGLLQVVHGMTEHIDRYDRFMKDMCECGYVVFGADNLGHGKSVRDDSELGFIAHENGWEYLCRDVAAVCEHIKKNYPALPCYLLGHSMGSFIVRVASERYITPDKLIIMGTGGPNPLASIGITLAKLIKAAKGENHISALIDNLAFGSYNDRFKDDGDKGWLTRDASVREKYISDKYCTFKFTISAMIDLLTLCKKSNESIWYKTMSAKKIPMLLTSGEDDPVGDYGKGVVKVYELLKDQNADVSVKLYKNYRHEILNDSSYQAVISDIKDFLL